VRANISKELTQLLNHELRLLFNKQAKGDLHTSYGPEDILAYIYAVCYSPKYRHRFNELLYRDYPRVPFTADLSLFRALVEKGSELIQMHLLEYIDISKINVSFIG
jgi:predicted helicase